MNLVAPNPAAPSAPDATTASRRTGDPALAAEPTDAVDAAPFGQLLSRQIDAVRKGGPDAVDLRATDPRTRDPQDAMVGAVDDAGATSLPVATVAKSTGEATDETHPAKDEKTDAADVAGELASQLTSQLTSQLALVAQWAGVSKPATDAVATSVVAGSGSPADRKGPGIANARDAAVVGTPRDAGLDDRDVATTTSSAGPTGTQDRASHGFALAAIDAIAARPGAASASPDSANLLVAPDPAAAAVRNVNPVGTAAPAAVTVTDRLHEQVGSPAWSHEVGQAVLRIAANELQTASLRLNPEHLGPLDVQVRIDDGVAHVAFQAAHADTRQALEGSRATLDQMFQGQGLRTGDVSVAAQTGGAFDTARFGGGADANAAAGNGSGRRDGTRGGASRDGSGDGSAVATTVRLVRAIGLVDTFA